MDGSQKTGGGMGSRSINHPKNKTLTFEVQVFVTIVPDTQMQKAIFLQVSFLNLSRKNYELTYIQGQA